MESLVLLDDFWEGMMILSEQDIAEISLSAVTVKDAVADARAVEAALLAKLASAELPEPALPTHAKGPMFTADQLHASLQSSRVAFEQVCKHRDALQAKLDELQADLKAELDGNASLREQHGAKDNETMHAFIARVVAERDALQGENERMKQEWNRFHHLLKNHGLHPGRTDDDLLAILEAALVKLDELQRQEPVAWRYVPSSVWGDFVLTDDPEKVQIASGYGAKVEPLYAAPKALEPLTDEQIAVAFGWAAGHLPLVSEIRATRAIEAAHGITKGTP